MKINTGLIQERVNHFKDRCREQGLSLTHQRLAVYSRLAATLAHPTAEELHQEIHEEYPTVSLGTVYKTLDTLEQQGLIHKLRATGESARYDANLEPHHHLVCKICGRMEDVLEEKVTKSNECRALGPGTTLNGFLVEEVRIDFRGICGPCRGKTKAGVKTR